jgi:plasmid stabilization system protein ParE
MKVIWSDFASETLKDIYNYYKEVASESVARKIKENIFITTRQLINHPESGQLEETLLQLEEGHRYLVNNNYKCELRVEKKTHKCNGQSTKHMNKQAVC